MNFIDAGGAIRFVFALILPICCYFLGIYLWSKTLRKPTDPPLRQLMLLGIVGVFLVVAPLMFALIPATEGLFAKAAHGDVYAFIGATFTYIISLGVYLEQGLVVQEVMRKKIHDITPLPPSSEEQKTG